MTENIFEQREKIFPKLVKQIENKLRSVLLRKLMFKMPSEHRLFVLRSMLNHHFEQAKTRADLKDIFELDNKFYKLQSRLSIRVNGGQHPKHRLMKYHDFFAGRIGDAMKVLDIGCGMGEVAYAVALNSQAHVTGIDLAEEYIEKARKKKHKRLSFVLGDAIKDLPGEDFDICILSNVLEHIDERPALLKRVKENNCIKKFLIRVPSFERDWRVPMKKELGIEWRLDIDHRLEYTPETILEDLTRAELRINHFECRWGEYWLEAVPA